MLLNKTKRSLASAVFGLVILAINTGAPAADPRAKAPKADAPAVGPISWDTIPARVRHEGGTPAPFRVVTWTGEASQARMNCVLRRVTDGVDVLVTPGGVMLQKEKGILDVVLEDKTAPFLDAAPDGRDIWISSNKGLFLVNSAGKVLGKVDEAGGLPKSDTPIQIAALAPGLLVANGSAPDPKDAGFNDAWVASVTYDGKEGSPIHVAVIASESKLPDGWFPPMEGHKWRFEPVRVIPIGNFADPDEDSRAWVLVKGPLETKFSSVEINARTLEATLRIPKKASDLPPPPENAAPVQALEDKRDSATGQSRGPKKVAVAPQQWVPFTGERDAVFRSDNGKLFSIIYHRLYAIPIGQTGIAVNHFKRVADMVSERGGDFLPFDHSLYIAGNRWYRFDPNTQKVDDIGPGLQIAGAPIEEGLSYAVSAHFGLCAFSLKEGCFHPFSVDPAKPLHGHPTSEGFGGKSGQTYAPPIVAH